MGPHLRLRVGLTAATLVTAVVVTVVVDANALRSLPDLLLAIVLPYTGYLVGVRSLAGSLLVGMALGATVIWAQADAANAWAIGPGFAGLSYLLLLVYAPLAVVAVILVELGIWLVGRRSGTRPVPPPPA